MTTPFPSRQAASASWSGAAKTKPTTSKSEWRCTRCDKLLGVCRDGQMLALCAGARVLRGLSSRGHLPRLRDAEPSERPHTLTRASTLNTLKPQRRATPPPGHEKAPDAWPQGRRPVSFAWHEIRDHLMHSSSALGFQRSFDAIRRAGNPLAQFRDPAAVLDTLHRGSGDSDQKNLVLTALVSAAQSVGPPADCALTLMLLALWPGLDAIRRRLVWRKICSPDEVVSEIFARTTETIRGLDLERVNWIAATVLMNVERDMIRARQREIRRQNVISDTDPDEVPADHGAQEPALGHARLQNNMRRLIGADAALVIRVAVEGFSQAEVAIELGLSEAAARKRYQRATRKLRDALHERV